MPSLWKSHTIESIGGIKIKREYLLDEMPDSAFVWVPQMKHGISPMYCPMWPDVYAYIKTGGNPEICCPHHSGFDQGVIDPLWNPSLFKRRIEKMREWGITKVVAPEFSVWIDFPVIEQLLNHFKTSVVINNLAKEGIKILPNVVAGHPELREISLSMWPHEMPFAFYDLNHISGHGNLTESNIRFEIRAMDDLKKMARYKMDNILKQQKNDTIRKEHDECSFCFMYYPRLIAGTHK